MRHAVVPLSTPWLQPGHKLELRVLVLDRTNATRAFRRDRRVRGDHRARGWLLIMKPGIDAGINMVR